MLSLAWPLFFLCVGSSLLVLFWALLPLSNFRRFRRMAGGRWELWHCAIMEQDLGERWFQVETWTPKGQRLEGWPTREILEREMDGVTVTKAHLKFLGRD